MIIKHSYKISIILIVSGILIFLSSQKALSAYIPDSAFYTPNNNFRVLNIKRAPFFAKGDGKTDDTKAFIKAYDFVLNSIDEAGWINAKPNSENTSYVIYIPNGEYLVSDTIIYSDNTRLYDMKLNKRDNSLTTRKWGVSEAVVWIRIIGESKDKTILRLEDSSKGYEHSQNKPVISFSKSGFNNLVARNKISDLTIEIGKNNPGAVGLLFSGANSAYIENVRIESKDRRGKTGISFPTPPSMGWHSNLEIIGFDYGIHLSAYHASHNSFENIKLVNQNVAGVFLEKGSASFENLSVIGNQLNAAVKTNPQSLLNIHNSKLICVGTCSFGIESTKGHARITNTIVKGYRNTIKTNTASFKNDSIDSITIGGNGRINYIHDILHDFKAKSPPKVYKTSNNADWTSPDLFIDSNAKSTSIRRHFQSALDSGKPIVFLPSSKYVVDSTIKIPCSVKTISGLYTNIASFKYFKGDSVFEINDECDTPLVIEEIEYTGNKTFILHRSQRVVYLKTLTTVNHLYKNTNTINRKELFLSNINGWGKSKYSCRNQDVWGRFINTESPGKYNFYLDNCKFWLLGFKTEKLNTNFVLRNKSWLKVLGGVVNQFDQTRRKGVMSDLPLIDSNNSSLSISLTSTGPNNKSHGFENFASLGLGNRKKYISWDLFPKRERKGRQIIVPHFQHSSL